MSPRQGGGQGPRRGAADRLAETAAWIAAVAARWDGRVAAIAAVAEDRDEPWTGRTCCSSGRLAQASGSGHHRGVESTRLDRWLWAVRLTKTRPDAASACRGGHVRVNDRPAKPATLVQPGDEVRARVHDTTRIVEVVRVIQKRVGAADAATCFIDHTPAPPPEAAIPVARRDRGAGRPTKRERRILDEFRAGGL